MNLSWPRLILAFVIVAALAASISVGEEPAAYTRIQGPAEISVSGAASRDNVVQVALSGTITVHLKIKGGSELEIEPVQAVAVSDAWKERRRGKVEWSAQGGGREKTWRQDFVLEPQQPGEQGLNLAPVRYREKPDDAWQTVHWEPIPIKVTTEIDQADLKNLRDIHTKPEDVPSDSVTYYWLAWVGGAFLVLGLLFGVWEWRRRSVASRPPVSPERWAATELDRIGNMDLPAQGDAIRHHTLVAEVLRRYLDQRFDLKATGKTTAEFLDALRHGGFVAPPQFDKIQESLDRCDLAKFARVSPSLEECAKLDRDTRALVNETTHSEPA